jgi:uncharacterized membrane protein
MTLLPIHIVAGLVAIVAAAVALYAAKGARLHRESGTIFVYAMLTMSGTAAVMAAAQPNWANVLQGALTFYLVTSGLLTIRRHVAARHSIEVGAMLVALAIGVAHFSLGTAALHSVTGTTYGYPPPLYFVFGSVALVAAVGDMRMIRVGGLQGRRRIVRHLWRMCFATFIATGSFFLGQAKVFPEPVRIVPLLAIPALAPLVLMLYWLARVAVGRRFSSG